MMKMEGIAAFVAVAEAGSISEAARRLRPVEIGGQRAAGRAREKLGRGIAAPHDAQADADRGRSGLPRARDADRPRGRGGGGRHGGAARHAGRAVADRGARHLRPPASRPGALSLSGCASRDRADARSRRPARGCAADGYDAVIRHGPIADSRLVAWRLAPQPPAARSPRRTISQRHGAPALARRSREHRGIFYTNRGVADWRFPGAGWPVVIRAQAGLRRQQRRHDARCRASRASASRCCPPSSPVPTIRDRAADRNRCRLPGRRRNSSTWPTRRPQSLGQAAGHRQII